MAFTAKNAGDTPKALNVHTGKTPHTYMKGQTAKYEVQDVVNEGFMKIFKDVGVHEVQVTGVDIGVS
jgi:hypothetical protein